MTEAVEQTNIEQICYDISRTSTDEYIRRLAPYLAMRKEAATKRGRVAESLKPTYGELIEWCNMQIKIILNTIL